MNLGNQLAASAMLLIVATIIHGIGIIGIGKLFNLEEHALKARKVDVRAIGLMTTVALALFLLHAVEITVFGVFFYIVGPEQSFEEALFISASNYSTLGQTIPNFPEQWRLVAAIEGVVGFLLLGWSTAVFVTDMNHLLRHKRLP
jgi:hypothetical protein